MRYIRLYEGFEVNSYYYHISPDLFDKLIDSVEDISDKNIKIITKDINPKLYTIYTSGTTHCKVISFDFSKDHVLWGNPPLIIDQLDDDWFIVRYVNNWKTFIKCDQIEGLLKFLKDNNII